MFRSKKHPSRWVLCGIFVLSKTEVENLTDEYVKKSLERFTDKELNLTDEYVKNKGRFNSKIKKQPGKWKGSKRARTFYQ